jgi:uncharacterized protein YdhG (YjbR/CyaY superfamily)
MQAPAHINTPEAYIAHLEEPRRSIIQAIHDAIRKAAPKLQPHIAYGMLSYGTMIQTYANGRQAETSVIALASQKQHVSLYMCAPDGDGYLVEKNAERLGKVSVGKGCIRFKKIEDLNLKAAMDLVKQAAKLAK